MSAAINVESAGGADSLQNASEQTSLNGVPIVERRVGRPLHVDDDSSDDEIRQENYRGPISDYH